MRANIKNNPLHRIPKIHSSWLNVITKNWLLKEVTIVNDTKNTRHKSNLQIQNISTK